MGEMTTFASNGHTCDGYLAGKGPGVIVIQEWWGLVPHITGVADRFAAAGFTALAPDFAALGVPVIGVSKDTVKKHDRFKAKYDLAVTLASDEDGAACEAWGVWVQKKLYGRDYMGIERATFLIDEQGVVRRAWRKVAVKEHAAEVLKAVQSF